MDKEMKEPDFFIVGAPKCGTTAMYEYLKQHPEIFMPEITKEPQFFGTDFNSPRYIRNKEEYLSLFSGAKNEKRIGEASATYLYSKRAAAQIKEFCPSASIIIMLRNPVDMLYSLHSQFLYNGNEDIVDFEAALNAEEDRKQGLRVPNSEYPVQFLFYREMADYTKQVQRYLNIFDRKRVHIIAFDDFKDDTLSVYKETLHFLGVNVDIQANFPVVNPNKRVRSKVLRNLLENPPWFIRLLGKALMPLPLRQSLGTGLLRLNAVYEPRLPMDKELRKRLQKEFAHEVKRLSGLLNLDLNYWSQG